MSRFKRGKEEEESAKVEASVECPVVTSTSAADAKKSAFTNAIKKFQGYINAEMKEDIAQVHDVEDLGNIVVNKYVPMSAAFQEALEMPGVPMGVISCIYGKPDTGKTTQLMEAIVGCQRDQIIPILILTEHKFAYDRLAQMGGDPTAMIVIPVDSVEKGYDVIIKMLRDLQNNKLKYEDKDGNDQVIDMTDLSCFFLWDSIGNVMSNAEMQAETENWDKGMMKTAKALRVLTRKVNSLLNKVREKAGILFLNQSYMQTAFNGIQTEIPTGGDAIPYSSAFVLRTRKRKRLDAQIKGKDCDIGLETILEVVKNHISNKKLTASVFTVSTGSIPATKEALDEYKKTLK